MLLIVRNHFTVLHYFEEYIKFRLALLSIAPFVGLENTRSIKKITILLNTPLPEQLETGGFNSAIRQ